MSDYEGENRRAAEHWHVKKEISYTHMLGTLVLAGSLLGVYDDMSKRQVMVEATVIQLDKRIEKQDERHGKGMDTLRLEQRDANQKVDKNLDRINDKLDKINDKLSTSNGNGH